jgi:hypothetical protein
MPRWFARTAVIALLIATPVATWWHVGPLGAEDDPAATANVLFRPLPASEATESVLGRTATALVAATAAVLLVAAGRGVIDRRGWKVLTPLVLLGAFSGAYWRVLTAATPSYDIGSTLLGIFVALPLGIIVILVLVIWASVARDSLRSTDQVNRG